MFTFYTLCSIILIEIKKEGIYMERKLVYDLKYSHSDHNSCGIETSYSEMDVWYEDGTQLTLVIDITNGPEDYIKENEWYTMIANTKDENEMIEQIKSRLEAVLSHEWSGKVVYYILDNEKVILSK